MKKLSIAVISDLHCHPSRKEDKVNNKDSTYLLTDMLRSPTKDHPVESLNKLPLETIKTDLTIFLGDLTDKSNKQGMISGWNYILEIKNLLNSTEVIATVGNHDVDSYEQYSNYSKELPKGIRKGFPFNDEKKLIDSFWAQGCAFIERDSYRILVINSSHFHYNKVSSQTGAVNFDLLEYIEEYMKKDDSKINIAITHHHPIEHPTYKFEVDDKIENGNELLDILCENKFDLFVHGHLHAPFLTCHNNNSRKLPVLSSGSFSSTSNLMWTGQRNTFHRIEIEKEASSNSRGKISTWTFLPRYGWEQTSDELSIPPFTGFGFEGRFEDIISQIDVLMKNTQVMEWTEIINNFPQLEYLTPDDDKIFRQKLKEKKIFISGKHIPDVIYKK